ncbi:MAG: hypothetical protein A2289_05220 [Deltaproteobacteria bacterium RIFOXYA12_FULL_58_15]|nr:MAG: hypothetical protein A2289_05220 [Deltaproteobacteria bacterium RIFOXYA12_FULL_58_15]OGR08574.1 MAG: hypothetical protein A2341_25555 [Deltaproteobacteria bacterium RIFOXYB12_FULL_58_9]
MRHSITERAAFVLIAMVSTTCSDEQLPTLPLNPQLTVWNRCSKSPDNPNFYELLHLYCHAGEAYANLADLLSQPLAVGDETVIEFNQGNFITVVRRRNTGQQIALTTRSGLAVPDDCYTLEVFDDAFRLVRRDNCMLDDGSPNGDDGSDADDGPPPGD